MLRKPLYWGWDLGSRCTKREAKRLRLSSNSTITFLSIKTIPLTIVLQNQTLPFCSYKGLALQNYKAPELATVPCLDTETWQLPYLLIKLVRWDNRPGDTLGTVQLALSSASYTLYSSYSCNATVYVHFPFHPFHSSYHRDARYLEPFSCSHITFSSSRTVFLVTVAVTCIVQRCNVAHGFPSRTIFLVLTNCGSDT